MPGRGRCKGFYSHFSIKAFVEDGTWTGMSESLLFRSHTRPNSISAGFFQWNKHNTNINNTPVALDFIMFYIVLHSILKGETKRCHNPIVPSIIGIFFQTTEDTEMRYFSDDNWVWQCHRAQKHEQLDFNLTIFKYNKAINNNTSSNWNNLISLAPCSAPFND